MIGFINVLLDLITFDFLIYYESDYLFKMNRGTFKVGQKVTVNTKEIQEKKGVVRFVGKI